MKNKKFLILSFFIPLIIYTLFFYINGFLTDKMILIGDSQVQYYPLFHYLKGILDGTNSLFYSFSKSIGGSMFGTFFYYLSSPLNLLVYFINKAYILDFMTYLTIFKLSLCGLTMYIYMSKKFNSNSFMILIFSILYSLSGYNLNYFLNIMWLDVIALSPIVLLGIDKIVEGKSPILYIITLIYCIYSNYYISYMLCIFSVIYFIYEISLKYDFKKDKNKIIDTSKKFIIVSLLSGLICSFFLIPCILEMLNYGRNGSFKEIFTFNYNIFNLLANTYIGSVDTVHPFNTYSINLYCGIIVFPLIYLYFKNKNISKKEKILTISLILFMIIPTFIGPLNYIWHLFTIPFGYNYRYSFLLIIFLIRIAYKSYTNFNISKINILEYLSIFISYSVIILFIVYFKNYYPYLNYIQIWISNILLIIYFIILYKVKNKKNLNKILFILILIEMIINIGIVLNNDEFYNRNQLEYKYDDIIKYKNKKRITTSGLEYNSSLVTNHLGVNLFISTRNDSIYTLYKIGYNIEPLNDTNSFTSPRNYPYIFDSLFANSIIISKDEIPNYDLLEYTIINEEKYAINKNKNALELGYIINSACNNLEFTFPYDEKALNCLLNEENNFYKEIDYSNNENVISYKTNENYFIYMPQIKENIEYLRNVFQNNILVFDDNFVFIRNTNKNQLINLEIQNEYINELKIYYFDYELFNEKIQKLKNTEFDYTIHKNKLTANVTSEGGLLMLTIPYENGINIKLNGNTVKYEKVLDNLIGIRINPGYNEIEISYNQPGIIIGIVISIISITLTIFYIKKKKK